MLLSIFSEISDKRRGQGKMYKLEHMLLFSILAVLSGANSYRTIHTFINEHLRFLKKRFKLKWKKAPSYSTIREVIQGVDSTGLERSFRDYSLHLGNLDQNKYNFVNLDGKTLRGSFDYFNDQKAIQVFSAFLTGKNLILAHEEIHGQKTNEIPVAQDLIKNLGLKNCIYTGDAMHCQKKHSKS